MREILALHQRLNVEKAKFLRHVADVLERKGRESAIKWVRDQLQDLERFALKSGDGKGE